MHYSWKSSESAGDFYTGRGRRLFPRLTPGCRSKATSGIGSNRGDSDVPTNFISWLRGQGTFITIFEPPGIFLADRGSTAFFMLVRPYVLRREGVAADVLLALRELAARLVL